MNWSLELDEQLHSLVAVSLDCGVTWLVLELSLVAFEVPVVFVQAHGSRIDKVLMVIPLPSELCFLRVFLIVLCDC